MAHQGLDDLLRNLVLDQMHRERIPECLGRDRADGERDAVTLCSLYRLTYPAAGRVFAPDIPEPCAGGGLCGRKPFPEPLDEGRIGERHGPRRVIAYLRLRLLLSLLLFFCRAPAATGSAGGNFAQPALLERAEHHERRDERSRTQWIVQHKIPPGQRQYLIEPAAGVPQRINKQAFAEIGHF